MANVVVVGAQWGDEGKGKVVDMLAARSRYVVRYQGGNNAGHTVVVGGKTVILHLVPSGILQPDCICMIGNGVVVDPGVLLHELDVLASQGHPVSPERLFLSTEAHLILPWHRRMDMAREKALGDQRIGTTGRGIGPAYEDKVGRRGIRVADFLDAELLRERAAAVLPEHNRRLADYNEAPLELEAVLAELRPLAERLRPYARPLVRQLHAAIKAGEPILFEGAQGTFLDVDHGTYPFVTSSNTVAGGACAGAGVGPTAIHAVLGIAKAYTTRVGSGPFPTEQDNHIGKFLRDVGREYGATTGRPRRCGWFDAPLVQHAAMLSGMTGLALTKLDVLSGMERLQIGVRYQGWEEFPAGAAALGRVEVEYEEMEGWPESLSACRRWDELPEACRRYVERIEALVGVPVTILGVGPGRDAVIER